MTTPADFDRAMHEKASSALAGLDVSGEELLRRHPLRSKKEIAQTIGNGVTARGLTMVLFEEARKRRCVKQMAKELLFREIIEAFPNGWNEDGNVRPTVKIGSWHYDVTKFASEYEQQATMILRALATTDRPAIGWAPKSSNDGFLKRLFDELWVDCK